jgi:hypothetical protein
MTTERRSLRARFGGRSSLRGVRCQVHWAGSCHCSGKTERPERVNRFARSRCSCASCSGRAVMHTIRTRTIICYICAAPFLESLRCPNPARWQSTPPCAQSARNGVVDFRSKVADILGATKSSSSVYTRGTRFFINNRLRVSRRAEGTPAEEAWRFHSLRRLLNRPNKAHMSAWDWRGGTSAFLPTHKAFGTSQSSDGLCIPSFVRSVANWCRTQFFIEDPLHRVPLILRAILVSVDCSISASYPLILVL